MKEKALQGCLQGAEWSSEVFVVLCAEMLINTLHQGLPIHAGANPYINQALDFEPLPICSSSSQPSIFRLLIFSLRQDWQRTAT